jgi:glycosyltransferase involved in cell wall biosynthesis
MKAPDARREWSYLSEMAVSERHGGGLTIQRILGPDLDRFTRFVHLDPFADQLAIIESLRPRQVNLHQILRHPEMRGLRSSVGETSLRVLNGLGLRSRVRKWWAGRCANYLVRTVDMDRSAWLVVPQDDLAVQVMNAVYRKRPVPYVTWMMDDHVVRWAEGWRYPARYEEAFAFHLRHAQRVFAISPVMATFYKERFGVDANVLFGPADATSEPRWESSDGEEPVRLCYFGAVIPWQGRGLLRLIPQLETIDALLDIFSFGDAAASLAGPRVTVRQPVGAAEVVGRMREYDGVVIALSFEAAHRNMVELNIATKMSECLASGTPTVVVGPEYAAMVKFVRAQECAIVVDDPEDPIKLAAVRALKDPSVRADILERASRVATEWCSAARMQKVWRQCLEDPAFNGCARGGNGKLPMLVKGA